MVGLPCARVNVCLLVVVGVVQRYVVFLLRSSLKLVVVGGGGAGGQAGSDLLPGSGRVSESFRGPNLWELRFPGFCFCFATGAQHYYEFYSRQWVSLAKI